MGWKEVGSGLGRLEKRRDWVGRRSGVGWKEVGSGLGGGSGLERGGEWVGRR